jgi:hypothetical protein
MSAPANPAKTDKPRDISPFSQKTSNAQRLTGFLPVRKRTSALLETETCRTKSTARLRYCLQIQRDTVTVKSGAASFRARAAFTLIFLGFEFGEFLFGAGNVGFSGAAQGDKFFLAMDVCFGGLELGTLAFGGGAVRSFNCERER